MEWKKLIEVKVHFYQNLNQEERKVLDDKIFMRKVWIPGTRTQVTDLDRLLVAFIAAVTLLTLNSTRFHN